MQLRKVSNLWGELGGLRLRGRQLEQREAREPGCATHRLQGPQPPWEARAASGFILAHMQATKPRSGMLSALRHILCFANQLLLFLFLFLTQPNLGFADLLGPWSRKAVEGLLSSECLWPFAWVASNLRFFLSFFLF